MIASLFDEAKTTVCKVIFIFYLSLPLLGQSQTSDKIAISSIKFINEYEIPFNVKYKETTIGGLSGIDYDKKNDVYYFISDDRSAINPARFYSAKIRISKKGIDTIQFIDVKYFLRQNGETYPSAKQDPSQTPDPESIRFNSNTNEVFWTSEGERILKSAPPVLIDPSINSSNRDGKFVGSVPIPANLKMQITENGPHQNGALEGITFDPDFKMMYVAMEEPLYEDGPLADVIPTKSWTRIFGYRMSDKKNFVQYAYGLEPVAIPANSPTAFKINGISEILSVGGNRLLTVERSFSTGRLACTVRVFLSDLNRASSIESVKSLKENPPEHPVEKNLLLNMDDLGIFIDNIEGVTFGPDLPNGHKTLLFVSDNNFIPLEKMQLLLFEIIP